ncbi:2'-deoxynucleoside 5'-phosphate N-hydrolase 1-like [Lingula anatina]|uniref:Putative 2'-deoxynucleoside 5'-phosphate N-hydrolase 1 n=1 Tax=Lingula anatina TaxID=7574 RepID=A0A1S3IJH6_LINAN|nr:2'-deoxynucleoside 5'-phosphate N-hydrolase 1-like [Lingula anatina]|eukprot:XP_013398367.1 2'-deoxynucleoside 5'-phosphate N-hydrolase 1-like [Lingula anatina]
MPGRKRARKWNFQPGNTYGSQYWQGVSEKKADQRKEESHPFTRLSASQYEDHVAVRRDGNLSLYNDDGNPAPVRLLRPVKPKATLQPPEAADGKPPKMSRNIYFAGSIRAGRQDAELYAKIIDKLRKYGTVLTEHVGFMGAEDKDPDKKLTDKEIYDRDMAWLKQSDAIVAEVTQPSLGVGYEIGRANAMGKKILCLFRPSSGKSLSAMISGAEGGSSKLINKSYEKLEDVDPIFSEFFQS